ncbi:glucosaminidase domain-containing protein [Paraburkholderia antibiotica]|uniref:Mannosyl-glycoprotein endo-beta-N-acetylglucosamidase-like domain-containing protein n=1 Tax=Paraburkholderia antibiotica TaxID=2728839 RepID=A0A7Y0A114_9BURK|nr:glucosaminidase domain-containing protein [Paraburkholderia antibiotica]NML34507.1 hypothetical protein [Paraburkholderia antibiotica]
MPLAQRVGAKLGVAPNAILSQLALETGWGKSVIPGTNNLGNIKASDGRGVAARDNQTGAVDAYRAYGSPDAFADDYASLIARKYPAAVDSGNDIGRFASALKQGGYAQDPNYVSKLANVYGTITGAPSSPDSRAAQQPFDESAAALYGISPDAAGIGAAPALKLSMSPGPISKPLLDQQAIAYGATSQATNTQQSTVPDWGSWVDNYVKSIVRNA